MEPHEQYPDTSDEGQRLTASTLVRCERKIPPHRLSLHTNPIGPPPHAKALTPEPTHDIGPNTHRPYASQISSWHSKLKMNDQLSFSSPPPPREQWHIETGDHAVTYLVEAVHCRPPLAVRVQYLPAAVRNAHFLFSRLISTWKTSWSPSSSWLADRSIPVAERVVGGGGGRGDTAVRARPRGWAANGDDPDTPVQIIWLGSDHLNE